jgi:hypothetical protein
MYQEQNKTRIKHILLLDTNSPKVEFTRSDVNCNNKNKTSVRVFFN